MLKTTGSFMVLAPRALGADNDKVVGGSDGGRADETVEYLPKSRKSNHITNLSGSRQRSIQALIR